MPYMRMILILINHIQLSEKIMLVLPQNLFRIRFLLATIVTWFQATNTECQNWKWKKKGILNGLSASALAPISIAQPLGFFRNSGLHHSCSTFSTGFFLFHIMNKPTSLKKHRRPYVIWFTLLLCPHHLPLPHHNSCNLSTQWSSWYYLNLSYFRVFTFAGFCLFICLPGILVLWLCIFIPSGLHSDAFSTTLYII